MTPIKLSRGKIIQVIITSFILSRIMMFFVYSVKFSNFSFFDFINQLNVWDANWYKGYVHVLSDGTFFQAINPDNGQAMWAFFPGYPLLLCAIWKFIGSSIDVWILGSVVSSVCLMLSEYISYLYIKQTRDDDILAIYYILFMSFGPYSFYYSSTYTEGLFLLLLTCFLYFMRNEHYILMGISGALLSATRSAGVMIAISFLVFRIMTYVKENGKFSVLPFVLAHLKNVKLVIGTLAIPTGLLGYMLYLYRGLGDAFAFVHIEDTWEREPFKTIKHPVQAFLANGYGRYMLCVLIGVLIVLVWEFRVWHRYDETIFPVIILMMSLPTSTQSLPRFMFGSFFVPLFCCDILRTLSNPLRYLATILLFAYEFLLIWMWLGGDWAVLC